MFDWDKWQEIFETIRRNKLRTFLTGFSVAWGIFMLIVLLGSGEGLANGATHQFRDDATNSLWIYSNRTSVPHAGLKPGRQIAFTNADTEAVAAEVEGVEHITARFYLGGRAVVSQGSETGSYSVRSVHPDHQYLERTVVTKGRFLNELDIREHRKCAAIGELVERGLFGDQDSIGKLITINEVMFKVVGVFKDAGGEGEMQQIYLPISTAQRAYGGADRVHQFMLTTGEASVAQAGEMEGQIRSMLANRHRFAPDDTQAIRIGNNLENFERFETFIQGIRAFVWAVGIGTILAGVVGVSNIMMIVVQERTREFGVRKALGATPWSIVSLILQESILITGVAGYLGLVAGIALLELGARVLPEAPFFRDPSVDLNVAVTATFLLVAAGTLAGLFPARRAAAIRPVEALRAE